MTSEDKDVDMQVSEEVSKTECSISSKAAGASSCGSSSPATNAEIEDCASQETQLSKNSLTTDRLESSSSPASSDGCSRLEPSTEMDTSETKEQTDTTDSPSQAAVLSSASSPDTAAASEEKIAFKVIFSRKKYDVELPASSTILQLKQYLTPMIDVIPSMQKVMVKGLAGNDKTLAELGVTRTTKVLVVGSKFDEVITIKVDKLSANEASSTSSSSTVSTVSTALSTQDAHQKVLEKGPPDDVHPGIKNRSVRTCWGRRREEGCTCLLGERGGEGCTCQLGEGGVVGERVTDCGGLRLGHFSTGVQAGTVSNWNNKKRTVGFAQRPLETVLADCSLGC
ncbi:Ubiquitin domain [Trinorchestia longiramus]|nr:Ubiquitin domain [Trinorchestia longiramus]